MNIEFKIYSENELDSSDILGEIKLSDGKKILKETNTYLDSWLCGLVEGVILLEKGYNCIIDLVEEPYPIEFKLTEKNMIISYNEISIEVDDFSIFEKNLRKACSIFLKKIMKIGDIPTLKFLKDFIEDRIDISTNFVQTVIKKWK